MTLATGNGIEFTDYIVPKPCHLGKMGNINLTMKSPSSTVVLGQSSIILDNRSVASFYRFINYETGNRQ